METAYTNNHTNWDKQHNGPDSPPQGRLPPINNGGKEVPMNNMNNKIGVENPAFQQGGEGNAYSPQNMNGSAHPVDPESLRGSKTSVRNPKSPPPPQSGGHHEEPQKPLRFCSFIVNNHKLAFGLTLGGQIFMFVISGILLAAGYDLLPLEFEGVPLYLEDDDTYLRALAWRYRDESSIILKTNTSSYFVGAQTENNDILQIFYEGDNVLTQANLRAINQTEVDFISARNWTDFCKVSDAGGPCDPPTSLIRFFDGSFLDLPTTDIGFNDIPGTLNRAYAKPKYRRTLNGLLGIGYTLSDTEAKSGLTRSLFFFGVPQVGYDLTTDSKKDQAKRIEDFQVDNWRSKLVNLFDNGLNGMNVYYTSMNLMMYDTFRQVVFDMMLAAGSMLFIFIFMLVQTQSLWLTGFGLFSIIGSFICCNLIYRIVLDYAYFGIFHVLSIFIILGIGADDIFVFNDTWRATAHENHPNLAERLSACYRRASMSMLTTTLTTFVAFVANALSPLLGIGAFGIFSAVLVAVNYLSAIIFFPCALIFYHMHFENWTWPCCRPCDKLPCCKKEPQEGQESQPNFMVRFFEGPYHRAVTHKVFRWFFIVITSGVLVLFLYFATTLEVDEKQMQFFRDGNNYQEAAVRNRDGFAQALDDREVEVYISWGLRNQDRSSCHKSDFECKGHSVWDNAFDLNPKPAQADLLKWCNNIRYNLPRTALYDDVMRVKRLPGSDEVVSECFITAMNTYMEADASSGLYEPHSNFSLPVSEIKYSPFYAVHTNASVPTNYLYSNDVIYNTEFYRNFETIKSFWLFNGYAPSKTDDYRLYSVMLGESAVESADTHSILNVNFTEQKYGTRLMYAGIMIKTTLKRGTLKYNDGLDMIDAWNDFVASNVKTMAPSLASGVPLTPDEAFHDFKVKETLARSAMQGIVIGVSLAFVVLTIATSNIILSTLATLTIMCVTVTVTGLIPMIGWKLSVIESVNLTLVVGLAVDYVVHLSEAYNHSEDLDRVIKVRHMLKAMGVSIVSGAFSTAGASCFMMGAVLQFFFQFGIFVFATIGFSLLYSMCLFTPVLGLLGPTGTMGSLKPLIKRLVYKIKGRGMKDPDCEPCKGRGFIREKDQKVQNTDL